MYTGQFMSNFIEAIRTLNFLPPNWRKRYLQLYHQKPILTKIALVASLVFFLSMLSVSVFITLLYSGGFGTIPTKDSLKNIDHNLASEVYTADGVLLGRYYLENRLPAKLEEIPDCLKNALIAAEDSRFYEHNGIDYRALGRVLVKSILMQRDESGGGSTITQQLAKNLFPRQKFWFFSLPINKAREMAIATRLEKVYSKEEIIALYLNTIPFSGNVFGIKTASVRFFNTSPKNLEPEQAAVLVGMLKATTAYHPKRNPERSKERRNQVLGRMEKYGYLSNQESECYQNLPLVLDYQVRKHDEGIGTYFREHLRLHLEEELKNYTKPDGSAYNIYTDGLKIYTTIDSRLQKFAEKAAEEEMRKIQDNFFKSMKKDKDGKAYGSDQLLTQQVGQSDRVRALKSRKASKEEIAEMLKTPVKMTILDWKTGNDVDTLMTPVDSVKYYLSLLNTGLFVADPHSGRILAWVGGVNFKYAKFDHIKSRRQVGSTFKPVMYAQALRSGMNPCKNWRDEHITYEEFDNWAPKNVNDEYGGYYNMEGALKRSINTIAVQVILELKVDSVRAMARRMGINSPIPKEAGIALGGVDLTLFEMVNAFSTIANRGKKPELHYITKVETNDGAVLEGFAPPKSKSFATAMSETHADMMRYFLTKVVESDRGTAHRLRDQFKLKVPVAAKTGTSNDNRDGWFLGFTPNLAFGAWVGGEHPQVRFSETRLGQGSSTAMPICSNFLNQVYASKDFEKWQQNKFPELDSITLDRLDCYGLRHPEIDSILVDSVIAAEPVAVPVSNKIEEN